MSWSQQNVTSEDVVFSSQSESVSYVENKPQFSTNDSSAYGEGAVHSGKKIVVAGSEMCIKEYHL